MKTIISGLSQLSQLDKHPRPDNAQEEVLNASKSGDANPRGEADPSQTTYVRTAVYKIMT